MKFDLDTTAAKTIGGHIDSKGAYIGEFVEAWEILSKNGVPGIHLAFKDEKGQTANNLDVYTHSKDGAPLPGYNTINQIMTCLQLRTMSSVDEAIMVFNRETKQMEPDRKNVFRDLIGKKIGLVLRCEPYIGKSGPVNAVKIFMPFEAKTRRSAREVLDGITDAVDITNILADLKDKVLPVPTNTFNLPPQSENPAFGVSNDFDSDLPF